MSENKHTYDTICFMELAYEFDVSEKKEIEAKIDNVPRVKNKINQIIINLFE